MKLTFKIDKAIKQAALYHHNYTRKIDNIPYVTHPFAVAFLLSAYSNDEDVIIAALLHDVLEDVKEFTSKEKQELIEREFGERVYNFIKEVSEEKTPSSGKAIDKATWKKRKEQTIIKLKENSHEALLIIAADKIHNLMGIIEGYQVYGNDVWSFFNAPPDQQLWYYESIIAILQKRLQNPLVKELEILYLQLKNIESQAFVNV